MESVLFLRNALACALLVCLSGCSAGSRHHVFSSYHDLLSSTDFSQQALKKDALVVIDIDNTLLHNTTPLGTPQWFDWQLSCYQHHRACAQGRGFQDVITVNDSWLSDHKMALTESGVRGLFNFLDHAKIDWVIVTARSTRLYQATFENFNQFSIFPIQSTSSLHFDLNKRDVVMYPHAIFTSGQSKSQALKHYLSWRHIKPSHLLMIDDAQSNFKHFDAKHGFNMPFYAYRLNKYDASYQRYFHDIKAQKLSDRVFSQRLHEINHRASMS